MKNLEFICPRCREKIRTEVEERTVKKAEESILLTCPVPGGCGWFGYLPVSRGVQTD